MNFKGFTRDKSNRRFIFNRFLWSVQWKISESVQCKNFFSTNSIGQSSGRFLGQSNEQICPVEDQEGSFLWKSLSPEWLPFYPIIHFNIGCVHNHLKLNLVILWDSKIGDQLDIIAALFYIFLPLVPSLGVVPEGSYISPDGNANSARLQFLSTQQNQCMS